MNKLNSPLKVYEKLYGNFGPQGWWPITKKGKKYPGYYPLSYSRKKDSEKFEICLGAILTQNTSWKNVEKALFNLTANKLIDVKKINAISKNRLARLIRPSGYYNQKAGRIKGFAKYILNKYGTNISLLFKNSAEQARNELLSLSGIGPETADSMLLYAANRTVFVVDTYTIRAGKRLGWFGTEKNCYVVLSSNKDKNYKNIQAFFHNYLPVSYKIYNEFHALIVELGKNYCRKKPICIKCPLKAFCKYFKGI